MLHTLPQMLAPAVMERVTLVINHVVGGESVAMQRLQPHAGKVMRIESDGWPGWLPPPPSLTWRITPAGLVEWCGDAADLVPELRLSLDARDPAALAVLLARGERPQLAISGDARLAGDVDWLVQNLRWDVAADLERVMPPPLAHGVQTAGAAVARGLAGAVRSLAAWRDGQPTRPGI